MNSLALPIVHPAFQTLKRSGRLLHLTAAGLITAHAISHFLQPESSAVYFWCQILVAADIFILVFVGRQILLELPKVNLFFRFIEFLFFLGIATTLVLSGKYLSAGIHFMISLIYIYLFYCEKRIITNEFVGIHHTGISIPDLNEDKFFIWSQIKSIEAHYDSILINTSTDKNYSFDLQKNLDFAELEQIHEFCRHYLGER